MYVSESKVDDKQAVQRVKDILNQIDGLYMEAATIAEEAGIPFFSYDGPAGYGYGDGGCWHIGDGWQASSQSC